MKLKCVFFGHDYAMDCAFDTIVTLNGLPAKCVISDCMRPGCFERKAVLCNGISEESADPERVEMLRK